MKNGLLSKMLFGYFAVGVIGFFLVTFLSYRINYNACVNEKADEMYDMAQEISNDTMMSFYNTRNPISQEELDKELKLVAEYTDTRIIILNKDFNVIIDTDKNLGEYNAAFIYDFDPLENGSKIYQIGDFDGYIEEDVVSVKSIINYGFSVRGYVTVHYDKAKLESAANRRNDVSYITYAFVFLLSFIILLIFVLDVYRPIKNVLKATREYEKGNLKHKIPIIDPDDEIGALSTSINYVANEIDEIEDFQRKFIANVSHDFRSPLTSIKGYVEAMKDGVIPVEQQEKYLNIVISETERLEKLTKSMLSLNDMNTRGVHLNITEFSINDVIKQTIETFEGICKGKNINFDLTFSSKELLVKGDVDKICQVVYNLVDNAIKFSNNDSKIYISAVEKGDKVFVSVKDTGIGIPKEAIPKIWDRFYKSDLSRGKDKKGTGLGLCIVKEIIQAHNSNIDVISTVGVGTEFVFSLPLVNGGQDE